VVRVENEYAGLGALEGSARGEGNVASRLRLMRELHPLQGARLLDIGCGNGAYTVRMAEGFEEVIAVDLEPDRIEVFRAQCTDERIDIREADASRLALDDGAVDVVTAIETVEHLGPVFGAVMQEAHRVLRPGGALVLTTPNRWFPIEQHGWLRSGHRRPGWTFPFLTWVRPLHRRFSDAATFTPAELDALIEPHGFRRTGLRYMMPPLDGRPSVRKTLGPVLDAASRFPTRRLGQTLVMAYQAV
jgi:SAM-dependent methyltransferase